MSLNLSDSTIEKKALDIRAKIQMDYVYALDMEVVLQRLKKKSSVFSVIRADYGELENDEAFMDCDSHTMQLSPQVYDELNISGKRAKFTAAHELGHYVLGHSGNTKRNKDKSIYVTPKQQLQEIEANKFAAYLLVPTDLAKGCKSAQEIADRFQVSIEVSEIAFERIQAALRRQNGELRKPPAIVIEFLSKAAREGLKLRSDISSFNGEE